MNDEVLTFWLPNSVGVRLKHQNVQRGPRGHLMGPAPPGNRPPGPAGPSKRGPGGGPPRPAPPNRLWFHGPLGPGGPPMPGGGLFMPMGGGPCGPLKFCGFAGRMERGPSILKLGRGGPLPMFPAPGAPGKRGPGPDGRKGGRVMGLLSTTGPPGKGEVASLGGAPPLLGPVAAGVSFCWAPPAGKVGGNLRGGTEGTGPRREVSPAPD